jgi:tol-pal system protein YbgF
MMMRFLQMRSRLMASFVLAIFVSAPTVAQQNNQALVDLVIQVQQLQDEVRSLTGQLEDQSLELETLRERQRDQYLDLDQRINEVRGASPGAIVAGPIIPGAVITNPANPVAGEAAASGATVTDLSTPELEKQAIGQTFPAEDIPDVREPLNTSSSVIALGTPDAQARELVMSPEAEKEAYDHAFQSLKDLKYADAAEQFQIFVEQYPASDYADNAQYWLGESYYVTRNYDIALEAFQSLISDYPNSPKVADGLLKIGYTHYELKQWEQARAALEQVQQQHPGTTLARLAGSRLRSMKLEGHF